MMLNLILAAALGLGSPPPPSPGDLAFTRGDFNAAYAAYAHALAKAPGNADALLGIGTIDLYRNDLTDARTYLEQAEHAAPGDPLAAARLRVLREREPHVADYRISIARAVRIPFVTAAPLPLIRLTINGKAALLVLDTGAGGIDLTEAGAKRLGVTTHAAGEGIFAGGKRAPMLAGRIKRASVPGLVVRGIPSRIVGPSLAMGGRTVDGAMGTIFLSHFLATIDYRGARLVLRPRDASARFEANARARGANIVPMWLVADHFIFARGHAGSAPDALYNVDTGGAGIGVQLTRTSLEAAGVTPSAMHASSFTGGGGTVATRTFVLPSFTLGALTRRNLPGVYFPDGDQYGIFPFAVAGTISQTFFSKATLTFDFQAMKMLLDMRQTDKIINKAY